MYQFDETYVINKLKELLAIDSTTGYFREIQDYLMNEMKELDYCIAVSVGLIEKNGIIEPLDEQAEEKRNRELGDLRQQLKEAIKIQQAAEKQAAVFKEMYEFLLSKRMGA